ncbi:MAG TPA: hypothetical protein VEZ90_02500 [Blastocatellia bacterium]|nr:hypothetical protein [Blastocatellia bacterium]
MLRLILLGGTLSMGFWSFGQSKEERFWKWFQAHDDPLFAVKSGQEPICSELSAELERIHPNLVWQFGPIRSGKREFVLSADGIKEAFPSVMSLASNAPQLSHWTIVRFRQPHPDVTRVKIGGVELDARTVEFLPTKEGEVTDLTISVPGYNGTQSGAYDQAVYLLLDGMVGEYTVETKVGAIQVISSENRPNGHWMPLTRLSDSI